MNVAIDAVNIIFLRCYVNILRQIKKFCFLPQKMCDAKK